MQDLVQEGDRLMRMMSNESGVSFGAGLVSPSSTQRYDFVDMRHEKKLMRMTVVRRFADKKRDIVWNRDDLHMMSK